MLFRFLPFKLKKDFVIQTCRVLKTGEEAYSKSQAEQLARDLTSAERVGGKSDVIHRAIKNPSSL